MRPSWETFRSWILRIALFLFAVLLCCYIWEKNRAACPTVELTPPYNYPSSEDLEKNPNEFIYKYVPQPLDFYFGSSNIVICLAIYMTRGRLLELGMGMNSSPLMHKMGSEMRRRIYSAETVKEWYEKFTFYNTTDYHRVYLIDKERMNNFGGVGDPLFSEEEMAKENEPRYGVVYVDHGFAELRHFDVARFAKDAEVVIAHDAESKSDPLYLYQKMGASKHYKGVCKFTPFADETKEKYTSTYVWSNYIDMKAFEKILDKLKTPFGHSSCNVTL